MNILQYTGLCYTCNVSFSIPSLVTVKQKHNYTSCKGCESHTENNKTKTSGLKANKWKKLVVFYFLNLIFSPSFPSFYFNLLSVLSGHRRDDSLLPLAYFPFLDSLKITAEAAHSRGELLPFQIKDVLEYETGKVVWIATNMISRKYIEHQQIRETESFFFNLSGFYWNISLIFLSESTAHIAACLKIHTRAGG